MTELKLRGRKTGFPSTNNVEISFLTNPESTMHKFQEFWGEIASTKDSARLHKTWRRTEQQRKAPFS